MDSVAAAASTDGAVGEQSQMAGIDRMRQRAIELGGGDLFNELYAWAPPAMSSRINLQSATAIDALGDVADNDGQDCAICLHEDDTAVAWKETPCGHRFHRGCLEKWLQAAHGHDTCPMCRRKILPEAASGVMASKVGMTFAHGQMVVLTQYVYGPIQSMYYMDDEPYAQDNDDDDDNEFAVIENTNDGGAEE